MRTRFEAVRKALRAAGLPLEKELFVECPHTWEGGATAIADLHKVCKASHRGHVLQ